ncbi:MAG: cysteine hydrolase [Alphaproteobacteria bacterium HGW-Alphaproteobacteria-2]|nr:MAG: cysteine hydrolase [Alphaproteobacteria bacterium HGW-Alphaproteobacteria-2]
MIEPKTLLQLAGADLSPAKLREATLVLIDLQNEYLEGPLALPGAEPAIAEAARLLGAARAARTPVIHVAHKGRAGSLFDREAPRGQIVAALAPVPGEAVIEKGLPNAFAGTSLAAALTEADRKDLIVAGFMTHMCVSSTARAALDAGYRVTVIDAACATRSLPDGEGGVVDAQTLHRVSLVALSDRFAVIARDTAALG